MVFVVRKLINYLIIMSLIVSYSSASKTPSFNVVINDRITGSFVSLALGDAMGKITKLLASQDITVNYPHGISRIKDIPKNQLWNSETTKPILPYTSDTQLAILVLRTAIKNRKHKWDNDTSMAHLAKLFVLWSHDPDGGLCAERSPDQTCITSGQELERRFRAGRDTFGKEWWACGTGSNNIALENGTGSLVRVAPIGYVFCDQLEKAQRLAVDQSLLSHRHPNALGACAAMVTGIIYAIRGFDPELIVEKMIDAAKDHPEVATKLSIVMKHAQDKTESQEVFKQFLGYSADDALAAATYCMLISPNNIHNALKLCIDTPGNSNTIASLAGALIGARAGYKILAKREVNKLEKSQYLIKKAGSAAKFFIDNPISF